MNSDCEWVWHEFDKTWDYVKEKRSYNRDSHEWLLYMRQLKQGESFQLVTRTSHGEHINLQTTDIEEAKAKALLFL